MKLFWLAQHGEDPRGPLLLSQLKTLAQKGQLEAEALVSEDGSDDWRPAITVLGEWPAPVAPLPPGLPRPHQVRAALDQIWKAEAAPKKRRTWLWWMLVVLVVGVGVNVWFRLYFSAAERDEPAALTALEPSSMLLRSKMREWLLARQPGADVRVDDVSPLLSWPGGGFRIAHFTAGATRQCLVFQFNIGSPQVRRTWSPQDWLEQFGKTPDAGRYVGTVRIIADAAQNPVLGGPSKESRDDAQ